MYKAESKNARARNDSAVRQKKGAAQGVGQSEQLAPLEALAEGSPQMARQAQLAGMIDASPAMTAQRRSMDANQDSPRTTAQRKFINGIRPASAPTAGRDQARFAPKDRDATLPDRSAAQLKSNAVVDNPSPAQQADASHDQAMQREAVSQRTPEEDQAEEKAAWFTADHVHGNMLLGSGHITGGILKKAYLASEYKDLAKRKRIAELATRKLHLIDENMYGRGKVGNVMRRLDAASRIMHLIGSIAGAIALAANIAAFFAPAALPVGAVAGVIALAAHSAMAVLQTILIGRNLYRIRGLPPAEKAKILPTLYRDIAKLGFSILGVITGGVGVGSAMQSGGLMASHALKGTEAVHHGLHMGGDLAGETIGKYSVGATIAHQNEKEIQIGMAGGLDRPAGPQADASPGVEIPDMQSDISESSEAVSEMSSASQDAMSGADGLASDIKPLEELSAAEPRAQQSLAALDGGISAVDGMPKMKKGELESRSAQVAEAEGRLNLPGAVEVEDEEPAEVEATQKASAETTQMQATAQRDEKPGLIKRAVGWLKRKFSSFKKRVKRVIGAIQGKLTELVLKMAGIKDLPAQMNEGLAEQRIEAAQVMNEANAGRAALAEWKSVADKLGKK